MTIFTPGSAPSPIKQILFQGLDGQYLAIAENGLVQSIDGGKTWGYIRPNATLGSPAWPAGAVGHQLGWSLGPRSCTPEGSSPGICDDFETGLGLWAFGDNGIAFHDWSTDHAVSGTHSLHVHPGPNDAADFVTFNRSDIIATGESFMHMEVYIDSADLNKLEADVLYDGDDFTFGGALGSALGTVTPQTDEPSPPVGTMSAGWNEITFRFNETTGEWINLEVNGVVTDLTGFTTSHGAGSGSHEYRFRVFGGPLNTEYDTYWDDICLSEGALTWTSFGLYNNDTFPFGTAMPDDNAVVLAVAITTGGNPVPTISGTDVAFTEISEDDGLYGQHTEINPTVACHTRIWLIQKDGPSPDWNISGGLSSHVDFRGAYMMVRAEASGTIDTVTFTTEFDDGEDSPVQNGISAVYSDLAVETSITSESDSDLIISFMREAGYDLPNTDLTSVFDGVTNGGAGGRLGLSLANIGFTDMPAQYYAHGLADYPAFMTNHRVDTFYLLLRLIRLRLS